jgi:type I restriction enzyme R subunit
MAFNEDSRVKLPSVLHLHRLGYEYLSLKNALWDDTTNIFADIFKKSIAEINPLIEEDDIARLLADT